MKFNRKHFGLYKVSDEKKTSLPMNIQFFAEPSETSESLENEGAEKEDQPSAPTVEELLTKMAQKDADYAKLKNSFDAKASALSKAEKLLKEKMSAEEQLEVARKEAEDAKNAADEAKDARIKELEAKFRMMDYSKRYMGVGMDEKTSETLSELTGELSNPDKFFSTIEKFIQSVQKKAGEDAIQEIIKTNPEVRAGAGDSRGSLAVEKAKELAQDNHFGSINPELLKRFM